MKLLEVKESGLDMGILGGIKNHSIKTLANRFLKKYGAKLIDIDLDKNKTVSIDRAWMQKTADALLPMFLSENSVRVTNLYARIIKWSI